MSSRAREVFGVFEKRASEVDIYHDTTFFFFFFWGHEYVGFGPYSDSFYPAPQSESSEKGQNLFMPKSIKCITIIITLENIHKIETEKSTPKQFEQSLERLQVELLLFTLNKNTQYIKLSWL